MKAIFPLFTTSFPCACTIQEATRRISEAISYQHNNLRVIGAYYTGVQRIVLNAHTGGYVYRNSFMPIIHVDMKEVDDITQVSVIFDFKKSTKFIMALYTTLLLLFEITLLVLCVIRQLVSLPLLFIPLGMMILSYAFCTAGLYFSSKGVLSVLFAALACEDTKNMPPIQKGDKGRGQGDGSVVSG